MPILQPLPCSQESFPVQTRIRVTAPGFEPQEVSLRTTPDYVDAIGDGTPDFLRLHDPADRVAFRRWFTLLAESQYYRGKPLPEIDDCAALLRFAYREAMRGHDCSLGSRRRAARASLHRRHSAIPISLHPARSRPLPREERQTSSADDLRNGAFAQFANAETLWRYNTFSVGRNLGRARPGDLLFFRQDGGHMPFHAMILSRPQPGRARQRAVRRLPHRPERRFEGHHQAVVGCRTPELSRSALAAARVESGFPRRLSLEHSARW